MVKKVLFLLSLMIVVCLVYSCLYNFTFCSTGLEQAKDNSTFDKENPPGEESVTKIIDVVITTVRVVAAAIAIIMIIALGMKYMTSAPGDRADIKKHAIVYVVGAFILFAVPGIIGVLIDLSKTLGD